MTSATTRPGAPAGRLRRWLAGRTLRGRLIAGLVALLFVACATVGIVTYAALHGALLSQLDAQLTAASKRYLDCLHPPQHPGGGDPHPGRRFRVARR